MRQKFKTITITPLDKVIWVVGHCKRSWGKDKSTGFTQFGASADWHNSMTL